MDRVILRRVCMKDSCEICSGRNVANDDKDYPNPGVFIPRDYISHVRSSIGWRCPICANHYHTKIGSKCCASN
jgi:hypothetical protein